MNQVIEIELQIGTSGFAKLKQLRSYELSFGGKCGPMVQNDLSSMQLFKSNIAKHDRAAMILQGKIAR
jgi:hypothetical protein